MEENTSKVVYSSTSDFLKYIKDRQKEKANEKNTRTDFKKKNNPNRNLNYKYSE